MDQNLNKFNPTVAELTALVESTKSITATDLKDKKQLEVVKQKRIELKNARIKITKIGKDLREDAINFQKAVITQEKELIGIIEPEEERLEAIEEEAKQLFIREERLKLLPIRKEKLLAIDGVTEWATDEQLLAINTEQYEAFYNTCVADHNEKVRIAEEAKIEEERKAFEEEKRKEEEKKEAEAKAKELAEAKERAKIDAEKKKLEDEKRKLEAEKLAIKHAKELEEAKAKAKEEAEAQAKADAEAKAKAEEEAKAKAEAEAQAEKEKLEKRKAFISFREEHGYTEETKDDFITQETEEGYVLYKKVGVFKK